MFQSQDHMQRFTEARSETQRNNKQLMKAQRTEAQRAEAQVAKEELTNIQYTKGINTKKRICREAYKLFAEKGFKDVTMTQICEKTGLSRGGLYRHYGSTAEIFQAIVEHLMYRQADEFAEKIQQGMPAVQILEEVFSRYEFEMADSEHSLSIAIYEYFTNPEVSENNRPLSIQYEHSKKMWKELLNYGIQRGEFQDVDTDAVFELIIFSYQGVRMYSRLISISPEVPGRILKLIKSVLIK